ncbi:TetR family transcriptional regulator C-terminal domain-containing protein [Streptomyces sp. NPDC058374]|uniref:TetR family transcriptional regulator C-terminal domain-containing protein n=1 Tax=unclassified Streptomyces TaxID=2593676 RepID=UPI0036540021
MPIAPTPPSGPEPAPRRTPRRQAPGLEVVLRTAMELIAEHGLDGLTMAGLGRAVGMSSGHLLYYFRTKDELLLRTLEWSEGRLAVRRRALLDGDEAGAAGPARRLDGCLELYLPPGPRDPHWTLWLEVWNRSRRAGEDGLRRQAAIEAAWQRDLAALVAQGVARGAFRPVAPGPWAARLGALLDGLAIQLVVGLPGLTRPAALSHARAHVADTLLA